MLRAQLSSAGRRAVVTVTLLAAAALAGWILWGSRSQRPDEVEVIVAEETRNGRTERITCVVTREQLRRHDLTEEDVATAIRGILDAFGEAIAEAVVEMLWFGPDEEGAEEAAKESTPPPDGPVKPGLRELLEEGVRLRCYEKKGDSFVLTEEFDFPFLADDDAEAGPAKAQGGDGR